MSMASLGAGRSGFTLFSLEHVSAGFILFSKSLYMMQDKKDLKLSVL